MSRQTGFRSERGWRRSHRGKVFLLLYFVWTLVIGVVAYAQTNDLPDVDVLYIERTPRIAFNPNDTTYSSGLPAPGTRMTYLAHVKNWGTSAVNVPYEWWFDGALASTGSVTINPGQEVTVPFNWNWESADHTLEFRADPNNTLMEISKLNNRVNIRTNALLVGLWVEQSLYDYFHQHQYRLNDGSNGFEDWGQRMIRRWNEWLEKAIFPTSPNGALDRLALDKVVVVPDGALPLAGGLPTNNPDARDRTVDMQWGYPYHPQDIQPDGFYGFRWHGPFFIDFGSIHEMNHARFHIDLYGLDAHQSAAGGQPLPIQLRDDSGNLVAGTPYMPFIAWEGVYYNKWRDIMGAGPPFFDAYSAAVWNWKHHKRGRGNMNAPPDIGVFLNDLPDFNHMQFIDQNGRALVGAQVQVYQAAGYPGWYGKSFDNTPDLTFTTDADGYIHMGRNPFGSSRIIHTYGYSNADLILKVRYRGQLYFMFQEVTDFNLEFWRNRGPQQFVHGYYTREIDLRDNPTTVPNDAWLGNYFNGDNFQTYITSRQDNTINFNWTDSPAPGVNPDHFTVYWLGNIQFPEGWKTFTITCDGGFRLYIDGRLVFDQWNNQGLNSWTPIIYTSANAPFVNPGWSVPYGTHHRVEVHYRHSTGTARVQMRWTDQAPPTEVPLNHWRADYYSTRNLQGYITSRLETAIDYEYGNGSPDPAINGDNWSARWVGDWDFEAGTYLFTAESDDGMRVWIDDVLVLDEWHGPPPTTYTFERTMSEGRHRIRVEYYEEGQTATAKFRWGANLFYDGKVTLGDWVNSPFRVTLRMRIGNQEFELILDSQGRFRIPASIPPGRYDVSLQGRTWLRQTLRNVRFPLLAPLHFNLTNGDVNGDNRVDHLDLAGVLADFGRSPTTDPTDLNGDRRVDDRDLKVGLTNFGRVGD